MVVATTTELYTVVENTSGSSRVFGFLGPRGMRLAVGEVVALPGDLVAALGADHQKNGKRRKFNGFERALTEGALVMRSRPAPILYDAADGSAQLLNVSGGALAIADPTYV